mgnify:CR=1 FL=1
MAKKELKVNPEAIKVGKVVFQNHRKYNRAVKILKESSEKYGFEDVVELYKKLGGLLMIEGKPVNQIGTDNG